MRITCIASPKMGYELPKEQALLFGGKAAAVCYMAGNIEDILQEPVNKTENRVRLTLASGHHSVYAHTCYTLYLEGIPKILAMILNNEREYVTSEKSARYTTMSLTGKEKELYQKWCDNFEWMIKNVYPKMPERLRKKLAMENARYVISVFTPSTNMLYTVNLRQLNYIINWCKNYISSEPKTSFSNRLKPVLAEFVDKLNPLRVSQLNTDYKHRKLSIFSSKETMQETWGEVYATSYMGSLAQYAQAQRHRSLAYSLYFPKEKQVYLPEIFFDTNLQYYFANLLESWKEDMFSVIDDFPQGMMVVIHERGTYEKFIEKVWERNCGQAQLEIMRQTIATLKSYILGVKDSNPELYNELKKFDKGTRCNFGYACNSPCFFGNRAASREI